MVTTWPPGQLAGVATNAGADRSTESTLHALHAAPYPCTGRVPQRRPADVAGGLAATGSIVPLPLSGVSNMSRPTAHFASA